MSPRVGAVVVCALVGLHAERLAAQTVQRPFVRELHYTVAGSPSDPPRLRAVTISGADVASAAATEAQRGTIVPVEITVFEDRSFTFVLKTPPTPVLIRQAAGVDKGSSNPKDIVASITDAQVTEIAQIKMPDLNANDLEAAKLQVAGTARSMGIEVR